MEISLKVDTPEVSVKVQRLVVRCGLTELIVEDVSNQVGVRGAYTWEVRQLGSSLQLCESHFEAVEVARGTAFKLESARLMRAELDKALKGKNS